MKTRGKLLAAVTLVACGLSACMTYPNPGPTSPAYIGDGKTQEHFAQDDARCRDLAQQRTGLSPGESAGQSTAASAVLGALLGAGLGAGIGAAAGNAGIGAAIGAGSGALLGTGYGSGAGASSAAMVQQRYDAEYGQCMYAAGNKVPGMVPPSAPQMSALPPPPPPGTGSVPPPPGYGAAPPPPPQARVTPPGDPTRGRIENATRWRVVVYIDQDPNNLGRAPLLTLNPNDALPQNLDIGTHRVMAQAFVETQFGTRLVGQYDRSVQVDPRSSGWNLRFTEGDFR